MTIFDIIQLGVALAGLMAGFALGQDNFGLLGGVAGAGLGLAVGYIAGKLPFVIAWRLANFGGKSTGQLRQVLRDDQYYVFHLALAALMARGEEVESEKPRVSGLLTSGDPDRRRFGWGSLELAFPDLAAELTGFDPQSPSPVHLEKVNQLRLSLQEDRVNMHAAGHDA